MNSCFFGGRRDFKAFRYSKRVTSASRHGTFQPKLVPGQDLKTLEGSREKVLQAAVNVSKKKAAHSLTSASLGKSYQSAHTTQQHVAMMK